MMKTEAITSLRSPPRYWKRSRDGSLNKLTRVGMICTGPPSAVPSSDGPDEANYRQDDDLRNVALASELVTWSERAKEYSVYGC